MNIKTHVVSNSSHIGGYLIPYDHREKWMEEYQGMFSRLRTIVIHVLVVVGTFPAHIFGLVLMKYECVSPNLHDHVVGRPNCMAVHRCVPGNRNVLLLARLSSFNLEELIRFVCNAYKVRVRLSERERISTHLKKKQRWTNSSKTILEITQNALTEKYTLLNIKV